MTLIKRSNGSYYNDSTTYYDNWRDNPAVKGREVTKYPTYWQCYALGQWWDIKLGDGQVYQDPRITTLWR